MKNSVQERVSTYIDRLEWDSVQYNWVFELEGRTGDIVTSGKLQNITTFVVVEQRSGDGIADAETPRNSKDYVNFHHCPLCTSGHLSYYKHFVSLSAQFTLQTDGAFALSTLRSGAGEWG